MLGRHHFLLSAISGGIIIAPLLGKHLEAAILTFIGIAIGSLIPDVDSADATIFHTKIKGIQNTDISKMANTLAIIFPLFGYSTKYLIYKPSALVFENVIFKKYNFEITHRGFMHSLIGIVTATIITGIYILPILYIANILSAYYLSVFLLGYLIGSIFHLLQDSCTKSGVKWNQPFQEWKIQGELITSTKPDHNRLQNIYLKYLSILYTFIILLTLLYGNLSYLITSISIITIIISWIIFCNVFAKTKIIRGQQEK